MPVRVIISQRRVPLCPFALTALVSDALRVAGYASCDVGVLVSSDARLARLNADYRGRRGATDVLSFAAQSWSAPEVLCAAAAGGSGGWGGAASPQLSSTTADGGGGGSTPLPLVGGDASVCGRSGGSSSGRGSGCDLGDVFLSAQYAHRWAARHGVNPDAHLATLLVHGLVHLLGYDHETDADAERMEAREAGILRALHNDALAARKPWPAPLHRQTGSGGVEVAVVEAAPPTLQ